MAKLGLFSLQVPEEPGDFLGKISVAHLLQILASDQKARASMFSAFVFSQRWTAYQGKSRRVRFRFW